MNPATNQPSGVSNDSDSQRPAADLPFHSAEQFRICMADVNPSPRLHRVSRSAAGFFAGAIIGLILVVLVWQGFFGEPGIPPLTTNDWQQSFQRWSSAGVQDYDLEVQVTGRQAATYAVQVRNGQVSRATRDGELLPQQRTWTTWSVEGMFETIARDLDSVERHATGRAEPSTPRLQLRAAFDPELGFPQRYLRTEMVRLGANPEVSWRVVKFHRHSSADGGQSKLPAT
jgi:hypothetical protein